MKSGDHTRVQLRLTPRRNRHLLVDIDRGHAFDLLLKHHVHFGGEGAQWTQRAYSSHLPRFPTAGQNDGRTLLLYLVEHQCRVQTHQAQKRVLLLLQLQVLQSRTLPRLRLLRLEH